MNSEKNILNLLESLGYRFPNNVESIIEFENKFKKEIRSAKPLNWNNPLELLKKGEIKNIEHLKKPTDFQSDGLAQAARDGNKITDNVKKRMQQDREDAEKR